QHRHRFHGEILGTKQACPRGVIYVVIDIRDEVGNAHDLTFDRARPLRAGYADRCARLPFRVLGNAVPHLPREVEPPPIVLEHVDDTKALLIVIEATGHETVDDPFARVAEGRVAEVMTQGNGFRQLFVQAEDLGYRARDLRDLERVRETGPIVIA